MEPLVTPSDFAARNITPPNAAAIAAASAAVRDAAGVPISSEMVTITVPGTPDEWLPIPGPVTAVTSVSLDGVLVTDHRVWPSALWRCNGWGAPHLPVQVSMTFGLAEVPEDVKQLVCDIATMAATLDPADPRVQSESIDDYQVRFTGGTISAIELPERTRALLRSRFSGGAKVTGTR